MPPLPQTLSLGQLELHCVNLPRLYHLIIRVHLRPRSGAQSPSAPHTLPALFVTSLPHDCLLSLCATLSGATAHYCFKSFSCNTYRFPRKCCKQKTYGLAKPFRCTTYKKHGGGGKLLLTRHATRHVYPERPSEVQNLSLTFQLSNLPRCKRSFRSIHRDPTHQLRIEISRLLRHHFAGRRDFHHLLDVAGIQQKRNLRAPAVHGIQSRDRLALVCQVLLRLHRLRRNPQRRLQNSLVQQHHVQFALQRRNIRQELLQASPFPQRQHVERPLLRFRGGINSDRPFLSRARESRKKLLFRLGPLCAARERKCLRRKPRLEMPPHAGPGKIVNVRRHAVRRQKS